jgi:hypothetical protein
MIGAFQHLLFVPGAVNMKRFFSIVSEIVNLKQKWYHFDFNHPSFFDCMVPQDWLKASLLGTHSFTFATIIWWAWRHRNMMCLSQDNWSIHHLVFHFQSMVATFNNCLIINPSSAKEDIFIKLNHNNHSNVILNVDGGCFGSPARDGFGGLLRNYVGFDLRDSLVSSKIQLIFSKRSF